MVETVSGQDTGESNGTPRRAGLVQIFLRFQLHELLKLLAVHALVV